MPREYKDLVVGLDIGTAKVMVVVAEVLGGGALKLAGLGVAPSNGLKRGVVVNIDATVQSIQQALKEAELMADCKIGRVYTGITGSHIRGINSSGMVAVKDKEVTAADVARVVETARAITYNALRLFAEGHDAIREVTMAKLQSQRAAFDVADESLQIHGGAGYMKEYEIERVARDLRLGPIGGGTDEIMKEILGKQMGL